MFPWKRNLFQIAILCILNKNNYYCLRLGQIWTGDCACFDLQGGSGTDRNGYVHMAVRKDPHRRPALGLGVYVDPLPRRLRPRQLLLASSRPRSESRRHISDIRYFKWSQKYCFRNYLSTSNTASTTSSCQLNISTCSASLSRFTFLAGNITATG